VNEEDHFATQSIPQKSFVATSPRHGCCNKLKKFLIEIRIHPAILGLGKNFPEGKLADAGWSKTGVGGSLRLKPTVAAHPRAALQVSVAVSKQPGPEVRYRPAH